MIENGVVVRTHNQQANVKIDKKAECSSCGMCLFPKNADSVEISALNKVDAKVGDTVMIERKEGAKLLGAVLAFLIPLILIGLAVAITYLFLKNEIWIALLSVIFIVLWYTILAIIDKRLKNSVQFRAEIISIIKKGENINE